MPNSVSATSAAYVLAPILLLIVVYAALVALVYRYASETVYAKAFFKASTPGGILMGVNSGGVYLIVLAISAQYSANGKDFALNERLDP